MNRLLRGVAIFLLLLLAFPSLDIRASAVQPAFSDVPADHSARDYILFLAEQGFISGYPDGRFGPGDALSRAAAAKIAVQVAGLAARSSGPGLSFRDLPESHWSVSWVRAGLEGKLVTGLDDGTFQPDRPVTRAQLAVLALRATRQSVDRLPTVQFVDVRPTDWFYEQAVLAVAAGMMEAEGGAFRPNDTATRAEAARAFARAMIFTPHSFDVELTVMLQPQSGTVELLRPGAGEYETVTGSVVLPVGSRIRTAAASAANIEFADGSAFYLDELSELILLRSRGSRLVTGTAVEDVEVDLIQGQLYGSLVPRLAPDDFQAIGPSPAAVPGYGVVTAQTPRLRAAAAHGASNLPARATRLLLFASPASMEPGDAEGSELTVVLANDAGEPVVADGGSVTLQLLSDTGDVSNTTPVIPQGYQAVTVTVTPPADEPDDGKTRFTAVAGEVTSALTIPTSKLTWWQALFGQRTRAKVRMPFSVASIRGTFVLARVSSEGDSLSVLGGTAVLESVTGEREEVKDSQLSRVPGPGRAPTTPAPLSLEEQKQWNAQKDWVEKQVIKVAEKAPKEVKKAVDDEKDRVSNVVKHLPPDKVAPTIAITEPADGAVLGGKTVNVQGVATDNVRLDEVTVNGSRAKVDRNGNFSASIPLGQGRVVISATATDASGNTSSAEVTVQADSALPVIELTGQKTTRTRDIVVTGQAEAPAGIQSVTVNGTPVELSGGGRFRAMVALEAGVNLIFAEVTDTQGRTASAELEIASATDPPVVMIPEATERVGTPTFALAGRAEAKHAPLEEVKVAGRKVPVGADGSFVAAVRLKPGENLIKVEARDEAGNVGSASKTVVLDGALPSLRVTQPKDGLVTNQARIQVRGMAEAAAGIQSLSVNGQTVTPDVRGGFTANVDVSPGDNTVMIELADTLGRTERASRLVRRLGTPPVLLVSSPADQMKAAGAEVQVTGTASAVAGTLRRVTVNGRSMVVAPDGSFSTTVRLRAGENRVSVEATDAAGNTAAEERTVLYEASRAAFRLSEPAEGMSVRRPEVTVSGTVENVSEVIVNGSSVSVDNRGRFRTSVNLNPGENLITVSLPGSAGGASEVRRVFLATAPPAVSVSAPSDGATVASPDVTVSGTAMSANGRPAEVRVNRLLVPVGADGSFSLTLKLKTGKNTIMVTASDEAGQEASASVTVGYEPVRTKSSGSTGGDSAKPGGGKQESTDDTPSGGNKEETGSEKPGGGQKEADDKPGGGKKEDAEKPGGGNK